MAVVSFGLPHQDDADIVAQATWQRDGIAQLSLGSARAQRANQMNDARRGAKVADLRCFSAHGVGEKRHPTIPRRGGATTACRPRGEDASDGAAALLEARASRVPPAA